MATKNLWINLPVQDVERSRAFFTALGFTLNTMHGNTNDSACFLIGEKSAVLMLFKDTMFQSFTRNAISDTQKGTEMLISIDAESRHEVDELARKAKEAGGDVYAAPEEVQGWMYGCGFIDPDGHRWNVLYMDMERRPQM